MTKSGDPGPEGPVQDALNKIQLVFPTGCFTIFQVRLTTLHCAGLTL